jgi:flagellar biosynthesis/type III secretory pathway protein FliH
VLERVGGVLGAREGTGPDDDPLLRSQRRAGFERGRLEGRAEGREQGRAEGLNEGVQRARVEMIRQILQSRGIEVSEGFSTRPAFAAASEAEILAAALACTDEVDFLAALDRVGR